VTGCTKLTSRDCFTELPVLPVTGQAADGQPLRPADDVGYMPMSSNPLVQEI
jgi:hypothetical protein